MDALIRGSHGAHFGGSPSASASLGGSATDPAPLGGSPTGAAPFDGYVNDAFGVSHRAHASIVGPPQYLPSAAGRLLHREAEILGGLRTDAKRPFVAVLGGAKVSDKLGAVEALLSVVDTLVIGGGMCFTFLAAMGHPIGDSLCELDFIETCERLLAGGASIVLPSDITALDAGGTVRQMGRSLPDGCRGLDIGPGSAAAFDDVIAGARTVFWNGPMGLFEDDRFAAGTRAVAQSMAELPSLHRGRGRRQRGRRGPIRPGAVHGSHLDRGRRRPRTHRARRPARPGGAARLATAVSQSGRGTMSRTPLISGNWKMHLNHLEAIQLCQKLSYELARHRYDQVEVSLHPPFVDLRSCQTVIDVDRLEFKLGAQNCHDQNQGAFTGEVSPTMLAKLDVTYVIVGHSERRALFGETDEIVAAKAAAVAKQGMTPIVCVGETLEEREAGRATNVVTTQLRGSLAKLTRVQFETLVVAYEPVWAIGTGRNASPEDAQDMCATVRQVIEKMRTGTGQHVRIQYGGSVKPVNAPELLSQPDIDGALVGGASLDATQFARIVNAAR